MKERKGCVWKGEDDGRCREEGCVLRKAKKEEMEERKGCV